MWFKDFVSTLWMVQRRIEKQFFEGTGRWIFKAAVRRRQQAISGSGKLYFESHCRSLAQELKFETLSLEFEIVSPIVWLASLGRGHTQKYLPAGLRCDRRVSLEISEGWSWAWSIHLDLWRTHLQGLGVSLDSWKKVQPGAQVDPGPAGDWNSCKKQQIASIKLRRRIGSNEKSPIPTATCEVDGFGRVRWSLVTLPTLWSLVTLPTSLGRVASDYFVVFSWPCSHENKARQISLFVVACDPTYLWGRVASDYFLALPTHPLVAWPYLRSDRLWPYRQFVTLAMGFAWQVQQFRCLRDVVPWPYTCLLGRVASDRHWLCVAGAIFSMPPRSSLWPYFLVWQVNIFDASEKFLRSSCVTPGPWSLVTPPPFCVAGAIFSMPVTLPTFGVGSQVTILPGPAHTSTSCVTLPTFGSLVTL